MATDSPDYLDVREEIDHGEGFVGVTKAAKYLDISGTQVHKLIEAGELPFAEISPRCIRIPKDALREWARKKIRRGRQ